MVLRRGDLFGESAFIAGAPRSSTAIALSDGTVLAFDNATFQNLLEKNNRPVAWRVVQRLVRRLRDAEDRIEIVNAHQRSRSRLNVRAGTSCDHLNVRPSGRITHEHAGWAPP